MSLGRRLFLLPLLLLPVRPAAAHDHNAEASAGLLYEEGSTLFGFTGSHEWALKKPVFGTTKKWRPLSLVLDGSVVTGSKTRIKVLAGPRVSFGPRKPDANWSILVHALGGVHYSSEAMERVDVPFVWKVGTGVDFGVADGRGLRLQADWVNPPARGEKSYPQIGLAFVWRKADPPTPAPQP